jgi:hypothetical protein
MLVAALLFVFLRFGFGARGQALLVRAGLGRPFQHQLATRLDVALAERFLAMGLVRADIKARDATEGRRRVREYAFSCPQHLTPTQVHADLARAARSVHAEMRQARVVYEPRHELRLVVGYGRFATHRVVIRFPAARREIAAGPKKARLLLVIDDLGHNMNATTRGILDLGVPITLAVLPGLRKSDAVFEAAQERRIPTLLHLPMEPEGDADPGKHAVRVGMRPEEIADIVAGCVRRYKTFIGVNNHMGSRATADRPTMAALMAALRSHELLFVDSQTTPRSQGRAAARAAGVWCIANDLFLDDRQEGPEQVEANLLRLGVIARKRGVAVGIGHPHPQTLAALQKILPRLQAHGIELVSLETLRPTAAVARRAGAP